MCCPVAEPWLPQWVYYQIRDIAGCACARNAGVYVSGKRAMQSGNHKDIYLTNAGVTVATKQDCKHNTIAWAVRKYTYYNVFYRYIWVLECPPWTQSDIWYLITCTCPCKHCLVPYVAHSIEIGVISIQDSEWDKVRICGECSRSWFIDI